MAATVLDLEKALINVRGGFLSQCKMSVVASGSNPDLATPIAAALRALGYAVAAFNAPVDSDLMAVPDGRLDLLQGVCDLMLLKACAGRWGQVDATLGTDTIKMNQLFEQINAEAKIVADDLLASYGFGRRRRGVPRGGRIAAGNAWPSAPPPPLSAAPWPAGSTPGACGGFNP